jgi:hypothetical protein
MRLKPGPSRLPRRSAPCTRSGGGSPSRATPASCCSCPFPGRRGGTCIVPADQEAVTARAEILSNYYMDKTY